MKLHSSPYSSIIRTLAALFMCIGLAFGYPAATAHADQPLPVVAVHVSELTEALESMPALAPTPSGTGTSGSQWWYTSWRYFVAPESLKEALRSDGTPFVMVSDSDIAAGTLRNADGTPRYPILISLASEATADSEITPLREYVAAGGFLLAGSSSFTRNPDGTTRGDFALAGEMGVHMAAATLDNRYLNSHFTRRAEHRITSHIPSGTLAWSSPQHDDQTAWTIFPAYVFHSPHYAWKVTASDASVLAEGDAGPMLTVHGHGLGQIIYHGMFQPLIGHGGYDPAMYAYVIYRRAIEWAFESFSLPIMRVSPWPYQYDSAMMARHDFENDPASIRSIESSARFEKGLGVKGDYYFSTGALRVDMKGEPSTVASLRSAVSSYGATIGSHNGGLKNPSNLSLQPTDYEYWHWGPDEALDTSPAGYANGKAYAFASLLASFTDIEGWLAGTDNGRAGCGSAGTCPRTWVSPFFNSVREDSRDVLEQLGAVVTTGEQKISPFPHRTLSYRTKGKFFSMLTLPASDWYVGTDIAQSTEYGHTSDSITAAVDFYHSLGALINIYGHAPSNNGSLQQQYVTYAAAKPRVWPANSVAINDWWRIRAGVSLAPVYTMSGTSYSISSELSGIADENTALEITLPKPLMPSISGTTITLNGTRVEPADFRTADNVIKVRAVPGATSLAFSFSLKTDNQPPVAAGDFYSITSGSTLSRSAPGVLANDSDPDGTTLTAHLAGTASHGTLTLNSNGSFSYTPAAGYSGTDTFTYTASDGMADSAAATVTITVLAQPAPLFSDDFTRSEGLPDPLSPWVSKAGTWTVTSGTLQAASPKNGYASASYTPVSPWSDYSVETMIQLPSGAFGGGIGGRVNSATGSRYGAWIYPSGSLGGSNLLKLVKFRDWTTWSGTPMKQVTIPTVGTGWHTIRMVFQGSSIQVYLDGTLMISTTDTGFDSRAAYTSGGISVDMWTYTTLYTMQFDNVAVRQLVTNQTPAALDDSYSTPQDTALTRAAPGVLANDSDPEGATLTAQLASTTTHGTLTLNADGSFSYTPAAGYSGSDSFTYRASDGTNSSTAATVTITVSAVNKAPTAQNDSYSTAQDTVLTRAAPGVLTNDSDPEGATLTARLASTAAHGTLTLNADGSFSYTPTAGYSGSDSFTYQASDGTNSSAAATVTITVSAVAGLQTIAMAPATVVGGSPSTGTVTLSSPAPAGGISITLSEASPAVSVPANVTVPAGMSSATFTATTTAVSTSAAVTITAAYGAVEKSASLTVTPPVLNALTLNPTSVKGGATSQGTITLSGPAPSGGLAVTLSDNSSYASEPASVTIPAGSTSAAFTVTTSVVTSSRTVTISARLGSVTKSAPLRITR